MSASRTAPDLSGYASLMVPVHLGPNAEAAIKVAALLAERFSSRLIGIAADELVVPYYGDSVSAVDELLVEQAKRTAKEDLAKAETVFQRVAGGSSRIEWRAKISPPRHFILTESRAADMLVVGRQGAGDARQGRMAVPPGDLVMDLGRPLLLVPPQIDHLAANRIVIAWRDMREARRAVRDALPFLTRAERVLVVSIGPDADEQGTADVCGYLSEHGVAARAKVHTGSTRSEANEIIELASQESADLIVAGCYGHSRMREWLFGGFTKDLLDTAPVCCLLSH